MLTEEAARPLLTDWESFYVIVGSSAGALTGLQFVVIALIADSEARSSMREIRAFGSPTVVHFCTALVVSAIMSAPWHAFSGVALSVGICAAAGVVYALMVFKHAKRQTGYAPDTEDWLWYAVFPLLPYVALIAAALLLVWHRGLSLAMIAVIALVLLLVGIHNAWDAVTYIAVVHRQKARETKR
jgi:hypothetical protein